MGIAQKEKRRKNMKLKKVLAVLMASAMIMGMSVTTFAAPVTDITSDITITGLAPNAKTTVNAYQFASLEYDAETNVYSWKIESWATNFVELNTDGTAWEIKDGMKDAFKNAALSQKVTFTQTDTTDTTSVTFEDKAIGGYVFVPTDDVADYDLLFVVNTYDRVNSPDEITGKPVAVDVTAVAKMGEHIIDKTQDDDFVQIGETVNYTVKMTFPVSKNSEGETLNQFKVTDKPTGLAIDETTVAVTIGGSPVTLPDEAITVGDDGVLTVDFASELVNGHGGKEVVITYEATVIDTVFNNNVGAQSNITDYKGDKVEGKNGSAEITKVDAEDNTKLLGVEFEIYDLGVGGVWDAEKPVTPMNLVYDTEMGAYRPALEGEEATTTIIDGDNGDLNANGIIKVVGLDEGNYHFVETKAPDGYTINESGVTVTIDPTDAAEIDVKGTLTDTKLSSLPSTGGIGTIQQQGEPE